MPRKILILVRKLQITFTVRLFLQYCVNILPPCCCWLFQMSALPNQCRPVVQLERNLLENERLYARRYEIYVPPNGRGFSAEKCYLPPLLSEFLMLGFYEVGRGAFSCCLHHTPISVLIHYLWRIGTHRPRNTHSTHFYFLLRHTNISELLTILTAASPCDLSVSDAPNPWPLSHPLTAQRSPCASLARRSAGVMRVSEALVAVQSSWSRHGQRSLEWHR